MITVAARNCASFLILTSIFSQTSASTQEKLSCILTKKFHIHVQNHLPFYSDSPLRFHCRSGDDDLGNQTLPLFGDFNWSFCENVFGGTRFFCHFWWISRGGPKNMIFDVFNTRFAHNCFSGVCYWAANEDGIYFTGYDPPNHWQKMYNWTDGNGTFGLLRSSPNKIPMKGE